MRSNAGVPLGPFFTELDHRAEIKGSRDPLGIQPIWTRLGRQIVGNLTTVSDSLRDFTVLLLGLYLADQAKGQSGAGADLGTFLRWEQLCAYARARVNRDWHFRGVDQVRKRLGNGAALTLSREQGILSDQKTYGLWGLYTMPARASGLVREDANALLAIAVEFVERHYLRVFADHGIKADALRKLLSMDGRKLQLEGKDAALAKATAALLHKSLRQSEPGFYREHLLFGGPGDATNGRQQQLAHILSDTLDGSFVLSPASVMQLAERARKANYDALAQHLNDIRVADAVLGPMALLFSWLLGAHGATLQQAAIDLGKGWGKGLRMIDTDAFAALREFLPADTGLADAWVAIAHAARAGDYEALIRQLVAVIARVMEARGGAAWVVLQGERLEARFQDGPGRVPDPEALKSQMTFPYFIPSLRAIAAPLRKAA
jgi:hypothetical protein